MDDKRGFVLLSLIIIMLIFLANSAFVSADINENATLSITILSLAEENVSTHGIFEPLCCSGGTGDWCVDNSAYNETTGDGDVYCEGDYAGQNILVNVQHVLKFNFSTVTIGASDVLECVLEQSNGSLLIVNETGLTLSSEDYILEYAISNDTNIERNVSSSTHDLPWAVHNCSVIYNAGGRDTYEINDVIFVHRNMKWTTFDYQKAVFAESVPYKFFNNTVALKKPYIENDNKSYMRYLTFKHYAGSQTEEFCFDGNDSDGDLLIDFYDNDCRTFAHRYDVSEMNFTPPNFLSFLGMIKTVGNKIAGTGAVITGNAISSDDDNIVTDSLGNVNYWFTKNTDFDGSFKARFYESSPGSSGYGYTIKNFPNVSSVSLIGTLPIGYVKSYACGAAAGLEDTLCNINIDCSACGDEFLDFVMIVNSSDTNYDAEDTFELETIHGTSIETEDFTSYFDPNDGLNNTCENESSSATDSNLCDDAVNNDLDISTDYTYINSLTNTNKISWSRDCADFDCVGINGPDYGTAEQDITFSQGDCNYRTETSCDDGYDNDFNNNYSADAYGMQGIYYTDCHDLDCFGNDVECPSSETVCNDNINNDWDYVDTDSESASGHKIGNTDNTASSGTSWNNLSYHHSNRQVNLIDCEDPDCNNSIGGSGGELCNWAHEINCSDGFNNDVLQQYDCQVSGSSYGLVGGSAPSYSHLEYDCATYCRANVAGADAETGTECDDGIDNDWDYWSNTGIYSGTANTLGGIDCGWNGTGKSYNPDSDCNATTMSNGYVCEIGIEVTCNDSFSNDYDGSHTTSGGWNSTLYNEYFEGLGVDMTFVSNADCDDYDCQGVGNCPTSENPSGNYPAWCFDSGDNDLDTSIDCSDSDCVLARNPNNVSIVCFEYEMNASALLDDNPNTTSVQFCGNSWDDENKDSDNTASPTFSYNSLGETYTGARTSKMDCNDEDCRQKFGQCAPCSSNELVEWNSCFDSYDNDHDTDSDTADSDCDGQITDNRGYNETNNPSNETSCNNLFDDDEDGFIDCYDSDCTGEVYASDGRVCGSIESGTETTCNDDFDNDEDDDLDCYDSDCAGTCGYSAISGSGITYSPENSSFSLTGDVTISGTASTIVRKGNDLYVSYSYSGGSLGGITIVLGSYATGEVMDTSVFDVNNAEFVSNPDSFSMDKTYANDGYLTFTRASISSFSFQVKIPGKGVLDEAATIRSTAEVGTNTATGTFDIEVVNNETPTIGYLELEPSDGNITAGDTLQAVAGDFTGYSGGQSHSGSAGRCRIQATGPNGFSIDEYRNNCKSTSSSWRIYTSGTYTVNATIYDNTGNQGNTLSESLYLDVSPTISTSLARTSEKRVYFSSSNSDYDTFDDEFNDISGTMTATFITDDNNPFDSDSCTATIRDIDGNVVLTQDITGEAVSNGRQVNCLVDGRLDGLSTDGLYRLTVNGTDSRGYTVETSEIVFFRCNDLNSFGDTWDCALADFDVDGYTEGIHQPFNFTASDNISVHQLACDSCPSDTNAGRDTDGDGYDNACDPICGDGLIDGDEECDDANLVDGDGCDSNCDLEEEVEEEEREAGPTRDEQAVPLEPAGYFSMSPSIIDVEIAQGQTITVLVDITNELESVDMSIDMDYSGLERFMIIKDTSFKVSPEGTKTVEIEIFADENEIPEVYEGEIIVTGNGAKQFLDVIIQVKEKRALFDVVTTVKTRGVKPGGTVVADINMTNVGDIGVVNATLYYAAKTFNGTVIADNEESVMIDKKLNVERALNISKDTDSGNYFFYSRLTYEEVMATSADTFLVGVAGINILFIITMILILVIIIVVIILYRRNVLMIRKNSKNLGSNLRNLVSR